MRFVTLENPLNFEDQAGLADITVIFIPYYETCSEPVNYDAILYKEKNCAWIYRIRNILDQKKYVGSAIKWSRRMPEHKTDLRNNEHHSRKLQNAYNKYGEKSFVHEGIERLYLTGDEAVDKPFILGREQYWIDTLRAYGSEGYNMRPKADSPLGVIRTEETKLKQSIAALTSEVFQAACRARKDVPLRDYHRQAISEGLKGKLKTEKHKENLSIALINSPAHQQRVIEMNAAKKGIPLSEEQKAKISASCLANEIIMSQIDLLHKTLNKLPKTAKHKEMLRISNTGQTRTEEDSQHMKEGWAKRKERILAENPDIPLDQIAFTKKKNIPRTEFEIQNMKRGHAKRRDKKEAQKEYESYSIWGGY